MQSQLKIHICFRRWMTHRTDCLGLQFLAQLTWLLGIGKYLLICLKTAFSTGAGLYQFCMMPMGLFNAPPSFQPLMERVLRGLHWSIFLIYLDYIVYSENFSCNLQHLKEVFERFRTAGLKLKPSKCHLAQSSVTFLGHRVSSSGIEPDPASTEKVSTWPVPQSVTQVRAFLGLCSYYRRFIQDFAGLTPAYTQRGAIYLVNWSWGSFQGIKTGINKTTNSDWLECGRARTDRPRPCLGLVMGLQIADDRHYGS